MTTDVTTDSAPTGAQAQPDIATPPAPPADPPAASPPTAAVVFTAEQQAYVDRLIDDRLKRDREKRQKELDAKTKAEADKAKAEADAAEAERQAKQGEWEALARKHETTAKEVRSQVDDLKARLERADGVIAELVEARKAGLPEAMLKALEGRDIYDQLQLANAFQESLPAPAKEPTSAPNGRQPTLPTPAAQGQHGLTPEERRRTAQSSW